jgi:small subunit ribosomal protein S20
LAAQEKVFAVFPKFINHRRSINDRGEWYNTAVMPILKSAIKKLRRDRKLAAANKIIKERARAAVRAARKKPTKGLLAKASSALDKAAKKGIIHKNKAARLKSRLAAPA